MAQLFTLTIVLILLSSATLIIANQTTKTSGNTKPMISTKKADSKDISIDSTCQVSINKCSSSVTDNYFHVPEILQEPFSPTKLGKLNSTCTKANSTFKAQVFKLNVKEHKCSVGDKSKYAVADTLDFEELAWMIENHETVNGTTNKSRKVWSIMMYQNRVSYFTRNGYFKYQDLYLNPESYCISEITKDNLTIEFCDSYAMEEIDELITSKCCPAGSVLKLDVENLMSPISCVEVTKPGQEYLPYLLEQDPKRGKFRKSKNRTQPVFEHKILQCNISMEMQIPHGSSDEIERAEIRVTKSGKVYTRNSGNDKWDVPKRYKAKIHDFCIDGLIDSSLESNSEGEFKISEENQILLYCGDPFSLSQNGNRTISLIYFSLMIVAAIFLSAIVLIYAIVWDKQNIHGWTIASFSFSMFVYIICQATHHGSGLFQGENGNEGLIRIGSKPCIVIAVCLHFFYIATFSWMTVLNFDLWNAIVSMRPTIGRDEEIKRFLFYSVFGYGIPTIVVSVSLYIEFKFDFFDDRVIRPQYGYSTCDLGKSAYLYHAISVITLLFVLDIIFGGLTVKFLWEYRAQAQRLHKTVTANSRYNLASMFGKIFVLLGFSWIFEIAGWFITDEVSWYLVVFDIYNLLQSIVLFWIFVCKNEIKHQLSSKYPSCKHMFTWIDEKLPSKSDSRTISMATVSRKISSSTSH